MERFGVNRFAEEEEDLLELLKRLEDADSTTKSETKPKPKPKPEPKTETETKTTTTSGTEATTSTVANNPERRSNLAIGPQQAKAFVEAYKAVLGTGVDRSEVRDPDNVNLAYDNMYNQALIDAGISPYADIIGGEGGQQGGGALSLTIRPDEYVEYTGAPAYLTDILKKGKARNEDEARSAYAVLSMTESPEEVAKVLGGYYGYDFSPVAQELGSFGGKLQTGAQSPEEFHSFIEPILQEQIPYLQLTRGLNYQEALQASFNEDPMIQALYGKYGVTPMRQTDDGSTYLYDPFSYSEIRTKEVKDKDFEKAIKIVGSIAAAYFAPQLLLQTGLFGAPAVAATATTAASYSATQIAAASAITAGATTAVQGGDFEDILKSAGLAFAGATVADKLSSAKAAATPGTAEHQAAIKAGSTAAQLTAAYDTARVLYAGTQVASGAISGNLASGVLAAFGPSLTTTALDKVGLNSEALDRLGVNQDDLVAGLVKTQTALVQGADLSTALGAGLGAYVSAGGGIPGLSKDAFLSKMGEVLRGARDAVNNVFGAEGDSDDVLADKNLLASADADYFNQYAYGQEGVLSDYTRNANLPEELLIEGNANWLLQDDGSLLDSLSGRVLDPTTNPEAMALVLKLGHNLDYSQPQIDACLLYTSDAADE